MEFTTDELGMISESLASKSRELSTYARNRKWTGPRFKNYRASLRTDARLYHDLALKVQEEYRSRL